MRGAILLVLVAICLTSIVAASKKSYVRYVNSMPQFGKAKFSAFSPQTVLFDQVPQGYITSYSNIAAQPWNFTTQFTTNVTATSPEVDVNSASFLTVFTCQKSQRKLTNSMVYDVGRSPGPTVALLRTVNVAQYNYDIDVYNGSNALFNNIPYCGSSSYIQVPPGDYDFQWTVSGAKKRIVESGCPPNCSGPATLSSGSAYTLYVAPSGSTLVQDGTTTAKRSVDSDQAAASPLIDEKVEEVDVNEVDVTSEVKEEKQLKQIRKRKIGRKMKRSFAQRV